MPQPEDLKGSWNGMLIFNLRRAWKVITLVFTSSNHCRRLIRKIILGLRSCIQIYAMFAVCSLFYIYIEENKQRIHWNLCWKITNVCFAKAFALSFAYACTSNRERSDCNMCSFMKNFKLDSIRMSSKWQMTKKY